MKLSAILTKKTGFYLDVEHTLRYSLVIAPETVEQGLAGFVAKTQPDELTITAPLFDHQARLRSYRLTARIREKLAALAPQEASCLA